VSRNILPFFILLSPFFICGTKRINHSSCHSPPTSSAIISSLGQQSTNPSHVLLHVLIPTARTQDVPLSCTSLTTMPGSVAQPWGGHQGPGQCLTPRPKGPCDLDQNGPTWMLRNSTLVSCPVNGWLSQHTYTPGNTRLGPLD
jgi:hypothetical protein